MTKKDLHNRTDLIVTTHSSKWKSSYDFYRRVHFQDLWDRASKIMEQCWTRDPISRPKMSVIFEALWRFLTQRAPEDMKNFVDFFEQNKDLQGAPIPLGMTH